MKDYVSLVGVAVGALLALVGVWLTQSRTDKRDAIKFEHERVTKEREDRREKVQRLRPYRIELLFEVSKHLGKWEDLLTLIVHRSENDDSYDWDELAGGTLPLAHEADDLNIRIGLLFSAPFDDVWNSFWKAIDSLRVVVENAPMNQTKDLLGEDWERKRWTEISLAASRALTRIGATSEATRGAMRQIDIE